MADPRCPETKDIINAGVPVVLNTSFNENEPIVCTPADALDCFLCTMMDVLVLGKYMVVRGEALGTRGEE